MHTLWEKIKEHPYIIGGGIAGVLVLLYLYHATSAAGAVTPAPAANTSSADDAVEAAAIQAGAQVQLGQIAAQASEAQTAAQTQASETASAAVVSQSQLALQATQSTNNASVAIAKTQAQATEQVAATNAGVSLAQISSVNQQANWAETEQSQEAFDAQSDILSAINSNTSDAAKSAAVSALVKVSQEPITISGSEYHAG